jgi:hypothetical protein
MSKPRITAAAVVAAHDVLDQSVPENYFKVSCEEQRRMRMAVVREALIAAHLADQQAAPIISTGTPAGRAALEERE